MFLIPLAEGDPVPLDKALVVFGRNADCDVVLLNSRKVSRKHCCVARINDRYLVRDLGSMNGVRVNGQPVRREMEIHEGDELQIGDVDYRMQPTAPAKSRGAGNGAAPAAAGTLPPKVRIAPPLKARTPKSAADKPRPKSDPLQYSMEVPVALPEEGADFIVEETQPKMRGSQAQTVDSDEEDEVIDLGVEDIIDDDDDVTD